MSTEEILLVLKPGEDLVDLDDLATDENWIRAQIIPRKEQQFAEVIYTTENQETVIRHIDDHLVDIQYIALQRNDLQTVESIIRASLNCFETSELWDLCNSSDEAERSLGLRGLTAIASQMETRLFEAVKLASKDSSKLVRGSSLNCIARLSWKELLPLVPEIAQQDPDKDLKDEAATLLGSFEKIRQKTDFI